jgi:hypothetical protein
MQAFLICCHDTMVHITSTIIPDEYIQALINDELGETQYLVVKRGQKYDLTDGGARREACRTILSLMRYLGRLN